MHACTTVSRPDLRFGTTKQTTITGHAVIRPQFLGQARPARKLQAIGTAGLAAYVLIATIAAFRITGPTTHPKGELFPFFTWSLFSDVRDQRVEYRIVMLSLNGQTFDDPQDMRDIHTLPSFSDSRALGYKALQGIGRDLRLQTEDVHERRRHFEGRYFGRHAVEYQVMRHVYNPLQRWHDGKAGDDIQNLGQFHYPGHS